MAETVFITRKLTDDSIFRNSLENAGMTVYGASLIRFSAVPFGGIPQIDWIFFYSRNGVRFFLKGLEEKGIRLSEKINWAAMGKGTAAALEAKGIQPGFTGAGKPDAIASNFLSRAAGQKVLFPRAQNSLLSVQRHLEGKIQSFDLIVYKNTPKKALNIPDCDYVLFTSPLSVVSYLNNKQVEPGQIIISIGQSTAKALKEQGVNDVKIAENASEEALVEAVLEQRKA